MFLSPADEYFTHQTALTHAMVATSDPSWRERYWVSFQDTETGDTVLTLGLGRYPNQDVMEAFACFSDNGRQTNLRLSRSLLPDSHALAVGPLSCGIVEPLKELRFTLVDNDSGLRFDVTFEARFEPMLEEVLPDQPGPDDVRRDPLRAARPCAGWIVTPDGRRIEVTPDRWWAERDHSWGTRRCRARRGSRPASVRNGSCCCSHRCSCPTWPSTCTSRSPAPASRCICPPA